MKSSSTSFQHHHHRPTINFIKPGPSIQKHRRIDQVHFSQNIGPSRIKDENENRRKSTIIDAVQVDFKD